jgi:hypothetical protein
MEHISADVTFSITLSPDQPIKDIPYHHRPLSTYVNTLAKSGFVVSGIDEIYPPTSIQELYGEPWRVPRYLVFRAKPI